LESEVTLPLNKQKKPVDVPLDSLERVWFLLLRVLALIKITLFNKHVIVMSAHF
jgi:hypothetical protein